MHPTESLAQFIVDTRYDRLPPSVVEAAKIAILDGVANMLAGSTQNLATIIGQYVRELGGVPEASVAGWGFKTNAPSAAFANGVFGHCLDFEIQGDPPTHGTSSCLPAALALGEKSHASGKTIIEAYVVGWEIQTDRTNKGHFSAGPSGAQARKTPLGPFSVARRRPLHARSDGGSPSTRRRLAAAACSKAQCGKARSGHADQDGLGWRLSGFSGARPRDGRFEEAEGG